MMAQLTEAYDGVQIKRTVGTKDKKTTQIIEKPFLNLAVASTIDWFNEDMKEESRIRGGFLARFNIVYSDEKTPRIPFRPQPDSDLENEIINELKEILTLEPKEAIISHEAKQEYIKFYNQTMDEIESGSLHQNMPAFLTRRLTDVHKFAMLNCITRLKHAPIYEMDLEDYSHAISAVKDIMSSTKNVVETKIVTSKIIGKTEDILKYLRGKKEPVATHAELMQRFKLNKMYMKNIIETMQESDQIETLEEKGATGKEIKSYRLISPQEAPFVSDGVPLGPSPSENGKQEELDEIPFWCWNESLYHVYL